MYIFYIMLSTNSNQVYSMGISLPFQGTPSTFQGNCSYIPNGTEIVEVAPADRSSQLTLGDLGILGQGPQDGLDPRVPFVL